MSDLAPGFRLGDTGVSHQAHHVESRENEEQESSYSLPRFAHVVLGKRQTTVPSGLNGKPDWYNEAINQIDDAALLIYQLMEKYLLGTEISTTPPEETIIKGIEALLNGTTPESSVTHAAKVAKEIKPKLQQKLEKSQLTEQDKDETNALINKFTDALNSRSNSTATDEDSSLNQNYNQADIFARSNNSHRLHIPKQIVALSVVVIAGICCCT